MNKMIFIKEVVLKNDLTYLTLSYFLFLSSLNLNHRLSWAAFFISGMYLSLAWYYSIAKKYIFNSVYKFMIIPAIAVFITTHITPISDLKFTGFSYTLNGFFMFCFMVVVMYIGNGFMPSKNHNYYDEYEANNRKLETEYLKYTYRSLTYNNKISYHYDQRVNLYVFNDSMHSAGNSLFVKESDKKVVGSLPDYYIYFKELNINYDSMNEENLEVFKMYAI